jgi:hypothetical protein
LATRSILFVGAAAFLTVGTREASALPASKIAYVRGAGADECPDERELRRAVAKRVGYDPFFASAERTVVAMIDRTEKLEFSGQVRLIDAEGRMLGERKLEAISDCRELVQNMALAISVAIDDVDQASPPAPATPAPSEPPASAPPAQRDEPPAAPAPEPALSVRSAMQPGWRMRASIGATGTLGVAPTLAPGGAIGIAARARWFWLGVEGRADLPVGDAIAPKGRVVTSLLVASLVPCASLRVTPTPYLCALASLGSLSARAEDVAEVREASGRWLSLGGRLGIEVPFGSWLALYAQLDGAGTLTRHRLTLDGANVYRLPGASLSAGIGLVATTF